MNKKYIIYLTLTKEGEIYEKLFNTIKGQFIDAIKLSYHHTTFDIPTFTKGMEQINYNNIHRIWK